MTHIQNRARRIVWHIKVTRDDVLSRSAIKRTRRNARRLYSHCNVTSHSTIRLQRRL